MSARGWKGADRLAREIFADYLAFVRRDRCDEDTRGWTWESIGRSHQQLFRFVAHWHKTHAKGVKP